MIGSSPPDAQEARQHRRRGRAIDIVVAEDGDAFAARDGIGEAIRRLAHRREDIRVRHQPLDGRIEERLDRIDLDIAAGENARQELRQVMPLRNRERARGRALIEPVAPRAPRRRALDAEEKAVGV